MADVELGARIMIFLGEDDRVGHHSLHEALLDLAREDGMAGATVWRGIEGFGASGHVRTGRFPDAGPALPLAVEVIDKPERIEVFLHAVARIAPGSFITREQVHMTRPGAVPQRALDDPAPRSLRRD